MKTARKWMKPVALLAAALLLLSFSPAGAESAAPAQTEAATPIPTSALFHYEHDPRENPTAMRDIVVNPQAIYGFSPSTAEGSTLKDYANTIDWTNAEQVADARKLREAYHESMEELYSLTMAMMKEDKDIEAIARAVSRRRNELRLEADKDNPEAVALTKKRNLETYGDEFGPSADSLYEKYGSWDMVLIKALGTNPGMDACVGLYDEYYYIYDVVDEGEEEETEEEEAGEEDRGAP
ncbi:MAG: hypothetical protein IJG94_07835 [Clostridia bacterium]|nr:hypothetical protein [Clostridia bacterium]